MSYIFISHFLDEELDCDYYEEEEEEEYKKTFTRSIRVITDGPDDDGWIRTRGNGSSSFFEWWIDPVEYPKLKVVYIYE